MDLKEINQKCREVLYIYESMLKGSQFHNFTREEEFNYHKNIRMLESIIDENLIDKLNNNYDEYYYIYYYCIVSKENLITNEIILKVIDNCNNKINPYLDIVKMNKQLNNDIITKILDKIKNISLPDTQKIYGPIPFDLRYHILKREEINEYLNEEVLNRYDKIELQNIIEKLEEDYVLECISNDINPPEELYKNRDLYNQNIAISVINNYLNCKKKKKAK